MNLNTSRFSGLSTLLANPAHLAALRKFSTDTTDTTATAADYSLTAKDLSYLGSACECALIDLGDLLETFALMHMDWQSGNRDTDSEAVARTMMKLTTLCGGLIPELALIAHGIANAEGEQA